MTGESSTIRRSFRPLLFATVVVVVGGFMLREKFPFVRIEGRMLRYAESAGQDGVVHRLPLFRMDFPDGKFFVKAASGAGSQAFKAGEKYPLLYLPGKNGRPLRVEVEDRWFETAFYWMFPRCGFAVFGVILALAAIRERYRLSRSQDIV